jgi:hypothetical protein
LPQKDFGKPNVTLGKPVAAVYPASLQALYIFTTPDSTNFWAQINIGADDTPHVLAGGPASVWMEVCRVSCVLLLCRNLVTGVSVLVRR